MACQVFFGTRMSNNLYESVTKKVVDTASASPYNTPIKTNNNEQFEENFMSAYTDKMVQEMTSAGSFDYDSASAFADKHGLSVRSVISKVKNLSLDYTPKPAVKASAGPRIRKADIVRELEIQAGANLEDFAGLEKADARSLQNLLKTFTG